MSNAPHFTDIPDFADVILSDTPLEAGNLEVRLAQNAEELRASQALRYQIYVGEIGAKPTPQNEAVQLDRDQFDPVCDHLLVLEKQPDAGAPRVIGTYRLLRRGPMEKVGSFYTASEYDISAMMRYKGNVLEVGRSCVHADYRSRAAMQLLWRGITAYLEKFNIDMMFGCGSLYGADLAKHKQTLAYLYHYHLAPQDLRITALPELYNEMNLCEKDKLQSPARLFAGLPPLIKGYMRLGGFIGDGAVLDPVFNTTDVAIIVETKAVKAKYMDRYASDNMKESMRGAD